MTRPVYTVRHIHMVVRVPKCYDCVMYPPTRMYSQNKKHDLHYSRNCTYGRNYLTITSPLPHHYLTITTPLPHHYLTITSPLPHPCNVLSNTTDTHSQNRSTICTMTGTAHTAGITSCYPSSHYTFTLVMSFISRHTLS